MASGILTNTTAMASIGTTYATAKFIALDKALVGAGLCPVIDRISVNFVANGGASTTLKGTLFWDANGDYPASVEFTFTRRAGITTATKLNGIASLTSIGRLLPMSPNGNRTAAGTLYLGLIVDANAIDVAALGVEVWTRDDTTAQG